VTVRLFVAIDVPEDVRRRIAAFAAELRERAPRARWVRLDGVHVTLKFIGETPPERAEVIRQALAPVRTDAPVEMEFRGAGFFPSERRPRVFWVGIEATPSLAALAAEIERRLEPLGIAREARNFHPHLTLARFENPSESGELGRALAESGEREFGRAVTREFYLYESRLKPGGSRYTRLETYTFAPETP
jgi:2'-5' RNA ligase